MNWEKDELISNIRNKLHNGIRLNETEIDSVVSSMIKAKGYTQEPYYEMVYHDEYDRKERRIMNPTYGRIIKMGDISIMEERFELVFNRKIREE